MAANLKPRDKPKFRYSRLNGLEKSFVRIKIKSCTRDFLWYRDMIGEEIQAEIREGSYYVFFSNDGTSQKGGLIDLIDAEIL